MSAVPANTEFPDSVAAVIDADDFAAAQTAPETVAFWREVEEYGNELERLGLDHTPALVERPTS